MATLIEKVDRIAAEVGVGEGTIPERLEKAAESLGLSKKVSGKPVVEQADICYDALFGADQVTAPRGNRVHEADICFGAGKAAPSVVAGVAVPVLVTEEAPVPMAMAQEDDPMASWVRDYPISGGPRPDQRGAYGWFDGKFGSSWPLHRAAMKGEVETIRRLCREGRDPNEKMTAWFDSEPLGWAASFGELGAVIALIQSGADPLRPANKANNTPLNDACRERHTHVVAFLNQYTRRKRNGGAEPAAPRDPSSVFDKSAYPNGGPRHDQNLPCITLLCAAPFALCPMHCLSAWGCAGCVDCLSSSPCSLVPCAPCDPNSKNPLWCCAEPLGWASSFGQLHTVMALVKNGALPETKNASGNDAYSDAGREGHQHIIDWLSAWEAAGRPRGKPRKVSSSAAGGDARDKKGKLEARHVEGCYVGACIVPCILTSFYVGAASEDELTASGCSLIGIPLPWSYKLQRSTAAAGGTKFELRAPDQQQDWMWHRSGCCFWGSPGWWALKVVPACS